MNWEIGVDIYTLLLLLLSQQESKLLSPGKSTGVGCHRLLQHIHTTIYKIDN